jgi:hypothetical protein
MGRRRSVDMQLHSRELHIESRRSCLEFRRSHLILQNSILNLRDHALNLPDHALIVEDSKHDRQISHMILEIPASISADQVKTTRDLIRSDCLNVGFDSGYLSCAKFHALLGHGSRW